MAAGLALRGRRLAATLLGSFAAAGLWDDIDHRSRWFRRAFLPKRDTWNVWAQAGDAGAPRTVVVVAHHDAAHSGLVFHPALPRLFAERFPKAHEKADKSAQLMWLVFLGPALAALGGLLGRRLVARLGGLLSLGSAAAMADIAARPSVPGANDNLSGVATLLQVAGALAARPPEGIRVVLVSSGSEESNSEGFQAWGRR